MPSAIDRQAVATAIAAALTPLLPGIVVWDRPQSFPYGVLASETLPALIVEVGLGDIRETYSGGLWGSEEAGGNQYVLHYLQALPGEGTASAVGLDVADSITALHANLKVILAALTSYNVSTLSGQISRSCASSSSSTARTTSSTSTSARSSAAASSSGWSSWTTPAARYSAPNRPARRQEWSPMALRLCVSGRICGKPRAVCSPHTAYSA